MQATQHSTLAKPDHVYNRFVPAAVMTSHASAHIKPGYMCTRCTYHVRQLSHQGGGATSCPVAIAALLSAMPPCHQDWPPLEPARRESAFVTSRLRCVSSAVFTKVSCMPVHAVSLRLDSHTKVPDSRGTTHQPRGGTSFGPFYVWYKGQKLL